MKQIFLVLVSLIVSYVGAVEYNTVEIYTKVHDVLAQNREALDQSVVSSVKTYLDSIEVKNDAHRLSILGFKIWVYDQTKGSDRTFEGITKYRDQLLSKEKFDAAITDTDKVELLDLWYKAKTDKDYSKKMYNLIKNTSNGYKFTNAGFWAAMVGQYDDAYNFYMSNGAFPDRCVDIAIKNLKDDKRALAAAQEITKKNWKAPVVQKVIKLVLNNLTTSDNLDQNDVKLFLQKVNKRYSRLMKEDEATWAPIIGDVRMTLAAY